MKIALVHDWLTGMRGGEKVLEVFCKLFPSADLYTLIHVQGTVAPEIEKQRIVTSYLQGMPSVEKKYRYYLPLMPHAIESFNLSAYDLVVSTSHCVAKGCKPRPDATHVCYCHTPMRYIWDQFDNYFGKDRSGWLVRNVMGLVRPSLQKWDLKSASSVSYFIANSDHVQKRIKKYYDRDSTVIHPPVDTDFFTLRDPPRRDDSPRSQSDKSAQFYLIVSALAPYKRIDIAIEAFNRTDKHLKIIGSGQSFKQLSMLAKPNIEFLGWQPNAKLLEHYRSCKALIFPGIEDFGIVPVEAMACGKPVVAYRAGGALETVVEHKTGLFFDEQTPESLLGTLEEFGREDWDADLIRQHAVKFGIQQFTEKIDHFIGEKVEGQN